MANCFDCPRKCGIDRSAARGRCRAPEEFLIARAALHMWEEPPVSGTRGSGTIFFGGCNLGCVYCQNRAIRDGALGKMLSADELIDAALSLAESGAHNVNLVTPSHYVRALVPILEALREKISIPIVWNSSGYESVESLRMLEGLVDIYLPDFKYAEPSLAERYSHAPDYPEVAEAAILEMLRQRGAPRFDEDGMMKSGVIVRHLVLPTHRKESIAAVERLAEILRPEDIRLSLMSQYTPDFVDADRYPALSRRVTSFEYRSVLDRAVALGFDGYFQGRASATADFTPDFS